MQRSKSRFFRTFVADLRNDQAALTKPMVIQLAEAFNANDIEQVITLIKSIFKNIPAQIFIKKAEAYYHSLIYLVFFYLGQYTDAEVNTNDGRLDCVVKTPAHIYILEFKLDKSADEALQQIKDKGYADKYAADPRPRSCWASTSAAKRRRLMSGRSSHHYRRDMGVAQGCSVLTVLLVDDCMVADLTGFKTKYLPLSS